MTKFIGTQSNAVEFPAIHAGHYFSLLILPYLDSMVLLREREMPVPARTLVE